MSEDDLACYDTLLIKPRVVDYRDGYQLVFGPGTGGSTLAETFNILEGFDFRDLEPNGAQALHLFIEAARIAYADRWQHLADEAYVDVPWEVLESKEYAAQRRAAIDGHDQPKRSNPGMAALSGVGSARPGGCTTHLSVVDKDRTMVAITQTNNMVWGSGVVVPGTGILFNDTMVLFDPRPGRANSIEGGKRPLSRMTPMLVLKDGNPFLTAGAPGGRMIMGTVMKVLHNVIDLGMGIQEACARVAVDASGDKIWWMPLGGIHPPGAERHGPPVGHPRASVPAPSLCQSHGYPRRPGDGQAPWRGRSLSSGHCPGLLIGYRCDGACRDQKGGGCRIKRGGAVDC